MVSIRGRLLFFGNLTYNHKITALQNSPKHCSKADCCMQLARDRPAGQDWCAACNGSDRVSWMQQSWHVSSAARFSLL